MVKVSNQSVLHKLSVPIHLRNSTQSALSCPTGDWRPQEPPLQLHFSSDLKQQTAGFCHLANINKIIWGLSSYPL